MARVTVSPTMMADDAEDQDSDGRDPISASDPPGELGRAGPLGQV